MNDLMQDITIFHKEDGKFVRYNKKASVRNTSYRNHNNTGVQTTDSAIIRVFDVKGYNTTWKCKKGDTIVAMAVNDDITQAPLTEMRKKYGKENVYEVSSVDKFIFDNIDLKSINHIKFGGR